MKRLLITRSLKIPAQKVRQSTVAVHLTNSLLYDSARLNGSLVFNEGDDPAWIQRRNSSEYANFFLHEIEPQRQEQLRVLVFQWLVLAAEYVLLFSFLYNLTGT